MDRNSYYPLDVQQEMEDKGMRNSPYEETETTSSILNPVRLVGCFLVVALGTSPPQAGAQGQGAADTVTYTEHVAPILFAHCVECHRPGEVAPFPLLTYEDAQTRGSWIAFVTDARIMPPWKAGPSDYAFKNERRLTQEEIDTIARWVEDGMPEGDPERLPQLPSFTEGWQLGPPDLMASMAEPFPVPADGPDVYRSFVLPLDLEEDVWVRAVDFRPSVRTVVHHSLFFLDTTGSAHEREGQDGLPGFRSIMGGQLGGHNPSQWDEINLTGEQRVGNLGGWAVGGRARELPEELAFLVPGGADIVLSTHFRPSGKPEREASAIGLYFADGPSEQEFTTIQLPPLFGALAGIDIPAGDPNYTISDSFILPVDIKAFNVGAHAHFLGKEIRLTATLPGGESKILLWIEDWDFDWQQQYQYADYVSLPAGTRLDVTITYDNSSDNPQNPSTPPVRVTWGEKSTDEMGSVMLQLVTTDPNDLPQLQRQYRLYVLLELLQLQNQIRTLGYEEWKSEHRLEVNAPIDEDSDLDNIPLLLEYALNLDPRLNSNAGLPRIRYLDEQIGLRYSRARNELNYFVEGSTDLTNWSSSGIIQEAEILGLFVTAVKESPTQNPYFLRLNVSDKEQ